VKPPLQAIVCTVFLSFFITPSIYSSSNISELAWEELSDRKLTDTGQTALKIYGDAWRHAETSHFIYHYHDPKEAETVLSHAEAYYLWVKQLFGVEVDEEKRKGHVFVFDDRVLWKSFNARTPEKLPGAEAFTNGFELFLYREPFYLEPQRVLAHEITHLVLFRFVKGTVPLFLNEGFAEFMATKAIAMKTDGDPYRLRTFQSIPAADFIPVEELVAFQAYPEGRETVFYQESELLTRYLALNYPTEKFYELLKLTAGGKPFAKALEELYGMDMEVFSEKFGLYARTR